MRAGLKAGINESVDAFEYGTPYTCKAACGLISKEPQYHFLSSGDIINE